MDIYWIKDKQRCGPSTVPDVISLLQTGELTPDTLGWHAGCQKWLPLRELPALADFLNKKAPADKEPPADEEEADAPQSTDEAGASLPEPPQPAPDEAPAPLPGTPGPTATAGEDASPQSYATQRVYLPRPIARLLARFVDYGLYAILYGAVISTRGIPYDAALLLSVNPLLWLPMLLLEAWMLSTWGTTPGKALMGIRVTTFGDASRLSFMRALLRALMAFTLGTGLMIPQLLPIMLALEYWMLRRRGITPWDARSSTLPTQKEPATPSRYLLAVISLYVSSVLFFACIKPWLPGMIDEIAATNPEMAQKLRELMPEEKPAPAAPTLQTTPAAPVTPAPQDTSLPGI